LMLAKVFANGYCRRRKKKRKGKKKKKKGVVAITIPFPSSRGEGGEKGRSNLGGMDGGLEDFSFCPSKKSRHLSQKKKKRKALLFFGKTAGQKKEGEKIIQFD